MRTVAAIRLSNQVVLCLTRPFFLAGLYVGITRHFSSNGVWWRQSRLQ
jgi:hypothetical protein